MQASENPAKLISTEELGTLLEGDTSKLRVLDATIVLSPDATPGPELFAQAHIPGSQFFDSIEIANKDSDLKAAFPPLDVWQEHMNRLAIRRDHKIVVYDQVGSWAAMRAWFKLVKFGAHDVSVLDGSLTKWQAESRPVETGEGALLTADPDEWLCAKASVASLLDVHRASAAISKGEKSVMIVDSRGESNYSKGHPDGAINIPTPGLYNEDKTLVSDEVLREKFEGQGVSSESHVITTCGAGMFACSTIFALARLGHFDTKMYDGSWQEYSKYKKPDFSDPDWETKFTPEAH